MPQNPPPLPDFTRWPSFPFEGDMRVKPLAEPVEVEPPRSGEDAADCVACNTPDDTYIWVSERWRVRGMDRPTGLPMVLILECRSHLDIGDLPNLLAAELGVMTVRLERAIRNLDGVARVHVNRWGDGSAHLHMWFLARPYGRLQLRGTFLSLWDDLLPAIPEEQWLENQALVAEWLAGFGGRAVAAPAHIQWQTASTFSTDPAPAPETSATPAEESDRPTAGRAPLATENADTRDLSPYAKPAFPARDATSSDRGPSAPADNTSPLLAEEADAPPSPPAADQPQSEPDDSATERPSPAAPPVPNQAGASSENPAKPNPVSGTDTVPTTATASAPIEASAQSPAEHDNAAHPAQATPARTIPIQHDPKTAEALN